MSLYQCEHCGCCENTALGMQLQTPVSLFDWAGIEERKGMHLCSTCMPALYSDGVIAREINGWHGQFERVFLPPGQFRTNRQGNLEHIETGRTDYRAFEIKEQS